MRNIFSITRREVLSFFVTPIAYVVITGFTLLAAYFFFNIFSNYNLAVQQYSMMPYQMSEQVPNLNEWVVGAYYHTLMVILVFLVPLITMRLISEEKRNGTFELLLTSPISVADIVVGKFLGAAVVVGVMMLLVFVFPFLLFLFGDPGPELLPMLSGLLGLTLYSLSFVSIGMAVSSYSKDQIVSAVASMVVLLLFYVIHAPAESLGGAASAVLYYLSPVFQARDFIQGVIATKGLVYFASVTVLGLFLSGRAVDAQRWR